MSIVTIGGLDPSKNNFGMSKGKLNLETGQFLLEDVLLVAPKPTKGKNTRKNSIDLRHCKELSKGLIFLSDCDIVCVELPVGSQSANGMKSYGMCLGLVATLSQTIIEVTATEVKKASGNKHATKKEMIEWAVSKYPNADWLTHKEHGEMILTNSNEHIADSIGAIHSGVLTEQFQELLTIYKTQLKSRGT